MTAPASDTAALILAAGKGTRMRSEKPKVLQSLLGEPMLQYVFDALQPLFGDELFTVIGHKADDLRTTFPERASGFVLQEQQLGTGHALQVAWPAVKKSGCGFCLVVNGDTPLMTTDSMKLLVDRAAAEQADLAFITLTLDDPKSFGRVVRNEKGAIKAIIEAKDYDSSVHGPVSGEINSGIYLLNMESIEPFLDQLSNDNKSGEFYITDLVDFAVKSGKNVIGVDCGNDPYLLGINSPAELAEAEELLRARIVAGHLNRGVILHDAKNVGIGPRVEIDPDVEITGPTRILGETSIGPGALIHSFTRILNSRIEAGAEIHSFSHIEQALVGPKAAVGPYGRLRPGAVLEEGSRIGNFVEMKKAVLGKGAKASHLTYLGDAEIGAGSNIGAGTITCNYDGKNKHKTVVGENSFIGSNTALVAPVTLGAHSLIGAGSVITKDVDADHLALTRPEQVQLPRKK